MADLRRFFVDSVKDELEIFGDEFNHAVNVLRIKENEDILILDNSGYEYRATVTKINKKSFVATVKDKTLNQTETKNFVTLICGFLKGDKTELVVQKAVELGVKEIIVFNSTFSSAYMNENKLLRLNKVSIEAAKQCKRAIAPKVVFCDKLIDALNLVKEFDNKLFACEFASSSEINLSSNLQGSTAIVVGSEGGFSNKEWESAKEQNFKTVFLGKRILRAETCAISLTAIVMQALGELN